MRIYLICTGQANHNFRSHKFSRKFSWPSYRTLVGGIFFQVSEANFSVPLGALNGKKMRCHSQSNFNPVSNPLTKYENPRNYTIMGLHTHTQFDKIFQAWVQWVGLVSSPWLNAPTGAEKFASVTHIASASAHVTKYAASNGKPVQKYGAWQGRHCF